MELVEVDPLLLPKAESSIPEEPEVDGSEKQEELGNLQYLAELEEMSDKLSSR